MLVKKVQLSPLTDERMRRNKEKREEKIRPPDSITKAAPKWSQGRPEMKSGPLRNGVRAARNGVRGSYFPLMFLLISPHPLICERGELYHLSMRTKLLHICQHVELVNYPIEFKKHFSVFIKPSRWINCLSFGAFYCFILWCNQRNDAIREMKLLHVHQIAFPPLPGWWCILMATLGSVNRVLIKASIDSTP